MEKAQIFPKKCPVCKTETNFVHNVFESKIDENAIWYYCPCGITFQSEFPSHSVYDSEYVKTYKEMKEGKARQEYASRLYAPIIEETTYGRMMLDVGFTISTTMDYFEKRGWIVWGIDCNKDIIGKGNIYQGDFVTYDFQPHIDKTTLEAAIGKDAEVKRTFDLIWMSHVLSHFNDPIAALEKAIDLLSYSGMIYISVPDIDFICKTGVPGYPHWNKREHYTLWTKRALVNVLEKLGMEIILSRRNFSSRFHTWYDVQILAQKKYF